MNDQSDLLTSALANMLRERMALPEDAILILAVCINVMKELFDQYAPPGAHAKLISSHRRRMRTEFARFDEVKRAIETGQPVGDGTIDNCIRQCGSPMGPSEDLDAITYTVLTLSAVTKWVFEQELDANFTSDFHLRFMKLLKRYPHLRRDVVVN